MLGEAARLAFIPLKRALIIEVGRNQLGDVRIVGHEYVIEGPLPVLLPREVGRIGGMIWSDWRWEEEVRQIYGIG